MKEELFTEMEDELILNNYSHVQFIHIQEFSFSRVSSLTISNLPLLRELVIENEVFFDTIRITLEGVLL